MEYKEKNCVTENLEKGVFIEFKEEVNKEKLRGWLFIIVGLFFMVGIAQTDNFLEAFIICLIIYCVLFGFIIKIKQKMKFTELILYINDSGIVLNNVKESNSKFYLKDIVNNLSISDLKYIQKTLQCKADSISKSTFFNMKPSGAFFITFLVMFTTIITFLVGKYLDILRDGERVSDLTNNLVNITAPYMAFLIIMGIVMAWFQFYLMKVIQVEHQKYHAINLLKKDIELLIENYEDNINPS